MSSYLFHQVKRGLRLAAVIACLAVVSPCHAQDLVSLYAQSMLHNGMEAPDFMVDSTSNTRLKDLQGRYVVLHFWASWCPDCRKDMPEMVSIENDFESDILVFVHVSYDTDREKWWNYVGESGMQGLQFCEMKKMKESLTAQAFGIKWIPAMYVLNTEGKVLLATVQIEKLCQRLSHLD